MKKIAFIGLGDMGTPMATNLLNRGYPLTAYDILTERISRLASRGARAAASPEEASREADVVITMLPTSLQVEKAILGPSGVRDGIPEGATAIDFSSVDPKLAQRVSEALMSRKAQYLDAAGAAVRDIRARRRAVLFAGGTPLYLKSLLRGADGGPAPDPALRSRLEEEAAASGSSILHHRLAQVDPSAAQRIHPNDLRRIVRALEVFESTGSPISRRQVHFHTPALGNPRVFCLEVARESLFDQINRRVQSMFEAGLVDEVRELLDGQPPPGRTARQALGYKEVIEHLSGRLSRDETIELVQRRTRQLAKRQLTWFRGLSECAWIPVRFPLDPEAVAQELVRLQSTTGRSGRGDPDRPGCGIGR